MDYIIFFLISSIFLYVLNTFLIHNDFCLDKVSINEKHKLLLKLKNKVPLSGGFYFITVISFLYLDLNILLFITFICLVCIGLLSDLKYTNSPKARLFFQLLILIIFLIFSKNFTIDTRIEFINFLIEYELLRILIISFFFLVLLNGFNFIDGVNNLCSLNFLIILIFFLLLSKEINYNEIQNIIVVLITSIFIFVILNFFGKNFLGDGGVYGLSFLLGIIAILLTLFSEKISPYFIANLFWYPAFENLFSIIRRSVFNKKNYLADNLHLHQLLFKYFQKKKIFKKKFLTSSFTGIIINIYLFLFYLLGYLDYSDTKLQVMLIFINTAIYLFIYSKLRKTK